MGQRKRFLMVEQGIIRIHIIEKEIVYTLRKEGLKTLGIYQ